GVLTLRLAPRVTSLTAVEIDEDMVHELGPRLPPNATLVRADFLTFDVASLRAQMPLRVAGNLPYNVASPILLRLVDTYRRLAGLIDATVMLQREVADRLAAPAGTRDYGVLSILVQLYAEVSPMLRLPRGAFRPMPKVSSSVVQLRFRPRAVALADEDA